MSILFIHYPLSYEHNNKDACQNCQGLTELVNLTILRGYLFMYINLRSRLSVKFILLLDCDAEVSCMSSKNYSPSNCQMTELRTGKTYNYPSQPTFCLLTLCFLYLLLLFCSFYLLLIAL